MLLRCYSDFFLDSATIGSAATDVFDISLEKVLWNKVVVAVVAVVVVDVDVVVLLSTWPLCCCCCCCWWWWCRLLLFGLLFAFGFIPFSPVSCHDVAHTHCRK